MVSNHLCNNKPVYFAVKTTRRTPLRLLSVLRRVPPKSNSIEFGTGLQKADRQCGSLILFVGRGSHDSNILLVTWMHGMLVI
jgi:hypothetical protein